jgi:predicted  nucleic acid-binding Zn-ribbon protein
VLPELQALIELQELDKEISGVQQALTRLPQELTEVRQILADLTAAVEAKEGELEELRRRRRDLEAEVADLEAGILASRQRLMEIKSNIEYKAMLKEIAFKEDQRDQKETLVLEVLEQLEAGQQELAALKERRAEQEAVVQRVSGAVAEESTRLEAEVAALEEKRQALRQAVPAALLKRYEFIRSRRNGNAIAEVQEGVCLGCHMNILPQQFIDLQKGEELLQCPHCQRILYWLGEPEEEQPETKTKAASRSA